MATSTKTKNASTKTKNASKTGSSLKGKTTKKSPRKFKDQDGYRYASATVSKIADGEDPTYESHRWVKRKRPRKS
jgi:hypothetical protein